MTVDDIYRKEKISVRSYHVCKYSDLNSIQDLQEYYFKHKTFDKLRNCGRKSNEELIEICNNYQDDNLSVSRVEAKKENPLKTKISGLTRIQREVINSFILVNTNSLSVRSKNAISLHLKGNLKIKNFAEKILLSENFKVKDINNIGKKCVPELENFILIINKFLFEVSDLQNESHLFSLKNNFLIQHTYSISKIPSEILESQSIFLLTDFLLNSYAFFDETQTIITKKALKLFKNSEELLLENIAVEVNLTRERVRQIRKISIDNLFDKLLFIQNFHDDLFQKYSIDINSNQIEINSDTVNLINDSNKIDLSREFITYILFVYLHDSFSLVGTIEDVLQPKYFNARNRYNWKNFYLIRKEINNEIDFDVLTKDIENRLNDRIEESYSFNLKSYLSKFLYNSNNYEILDSALPIAEKIINDEFEISLDLEENIIFKRNTNKQAHEYSYEALEHLGKPSKIIKIFEKVIELHPNYDTDEAKLRASMKRKNGFVPIGRKSVFGLRKWENELDNFKGGTIRDIVEQYLSQFTTPKHISDITTHVLKYRPKSNQKSILHNLRLEESGLYVFYKNSQIGLSYKKYEANYIKSSGLIKGKRMSWDESLELLKEFINKENRLPYSSGCAESEKRLYRWINIQIRKCNDGKLEKGLEKLITEIDNKFSHKSGKRKSNALEKYDELIDFVTTNFRLPSSIKEGEENLYTFFYKQRKIFNENELETDEEIKFLEVAKLLQNIKYENKRN